MHQLNIVSKSFWSNLASSCVDILMKISRSSAKRRIFALIRGGKSFIKSAKSNGDRTEPCGTEEFGVMPFDSSPCTQIYCFLSVGYDCNNTIRF